MPHNYGVNIQKVLDSASAEHVTHGKSWYRLARLEALKISEETNVSFLVACGVIAALSPRNKWARNLQDARNMCGPWALHMKYATFTRNVNKAHEIKQMGKTRAQISEILGGDKTRAFFDNIYDANSSMVTIDLHMQMVALGGYLAEKHRPHITKKHYKEIAGAVIALANKYGLRPHELQAITWLAWRDSRANRKLPANGKKERRNASA